MNSIRGAATETSRGVYAYANVRVAFKVEKRREEQMKGRENQGGGIAETDRDSEIAIAHAQELCDKTRGTLGEGSIPTWLWGS